MVVSIQGLLTSDELANVPFLVLGNKIDVARAVSEEQLRYSLGLQNTYGKEVRALTKKALVNVVPSRQNDDDDDSFI